MAKAAKNKVARKKIATTTSAKAAVASPWLWNASCSLTKKEHSKLRDLLKTGRADACMLAVTILTASEATSADLEAIFTEPFVARLMRERGCQSFPEERVRLWEELFSVVESVPNVLTNMTFAAGMELARFKTTPRRLLRYRLKVLSEQTAELLAKRRGKLYLNGVATLPVAVAEKLASHRGDVFLNGLKSLSAAAAEALARHDAYLELRGLLTLSAEAAQALAKHAGGMHFGGMKHLSGEAAAGLAKHSGNWLYFNSLTSLPDTPGHLGLAKALVRHDRHLNLGSITELSPAAAEVLARHKGGVCLNGLAAMSDEVALALAKAKGPVELRGLTSVSQAAVKALGKNPHVDGPWRGRR